MIVEITFKPGVAYTTTKRAYNNVRSYAVDVMADTLTIRTDTKVIVIVLSSILQYEIETK